MSNIKNVGGIDYDLDDVDDERKVKTLYRLFPDLKPEPPVYRRRYEINGEEFCESSLTTEYFEKGYC